MPHYFDPTPAAPDTRREVAVCFGERVFHCVTAGGVFARDGLDEGTRVFCQALPPLAGRVLELGAGWGAMAVCLLGQSIDYTGIEVNERAADLARENLARNNLVGAVITADATTFVADQPYDWVVTNPPIRAGNAVVHALFTTAHRALGPGGRFAFVVRKQQGAESLTKLAKNLFGNAERIAREGGYWVVVCNK